LSLTINVRSVGENGAHLCRESGEEAFQEAGGGGGVPAGMDFQIDIARAAVDGDESVAFALLQRRQVFEIDVDEADRGVLETALVSIRDHIESLESVVIPCWRCDLEGAARCGRRRTGVGMTGASCVIRVI
jgi:hypothetical protein